MNGKYQVSALVAALLLSNSAVSSSNDVNPEFGFSISSLSAKAFDKPSLDGQVVRVFVVTEMLKGDTDDVSNKGWVKYDAGKPVATVWIPRSELASFSDMRRVRGCWPIKQVHPADGEATFDHIDFEQSGNAIVTDVYSRKWKAVTYIKDSLVFVRPVSNSSKAPFGEFFGLNRDIPTLLPAGDPPTNITLFPRKALEGCRAIISK